MLETWLISYRWILEAVNVFLQWLVPEFRIPFIDGVDLATWLYAHVLISQQKFSNGLVIYKYKKAMHSIPTIEGW